MGAARWCACRSPVAARLAALGARLRRLPGGRVRACRRSEKAIRVTNTHHAWVERCSVVVSYARWRRASIRYPRCRSKVTAGAISAAPFCHSRLAAVQCSGPARGTWETRRFSGTVVPLLRLVILLEFGPPKLLQCRQFPAVAESMMGAVARSLKPSLVFSRSPRARGSRSGRAASCATDRET